MNRAITLTDAQQACVEYPVERDLIVRGVAGSGKSLVIVKRALQMHKLGQEEGRNLKIGIFTYVNSLVEYTKQILKSESSGCCGMTVTTLDREILRLYELLPHANKVDRKALYENRAGALRRLLAELPFPAEASRQRILSESRSEWLMDEICWMKQHMFSTEQSYMDCVRKGRGRTQLRREDRPFVFAIYKKFYEELASSGTKTIDVICEELYSRIKEVPKSERYDVVLVDEAQDMPLNKLLIVRALADMSVTISADFAQKIYKTGFTWKEIGLDVVGGGSRKLSGTYRNTKQIALLASGLQKHNTERFEEGDITALDLPKRDGELPRLICCASAQQQEQIMCELIKKVLNDSPNASIGLLGRDRYAIQPLKDWLDRCGFSYEYLGNKNSDILSPGIKLTTYHSSKGLEFDVVFLPSLCDGVFPYSNHKHGASVSDEEFEDMMNNARNLLYVGMTRARSMLYMFTINSFLQKPSPLLKELDPTLMKVVGAFARS